LDFLCHPPCIGWTRIDAIDRYPYGASSAESVIVRASTAPFVVA
jgi:hypothetical protein